MGAGKSTVGRLLAPLLGWQFFDADGILIERTGQSIAGLFEQHGESLFREMEAATVAELLGLEHLVLALGGGALESPSTRQLLAASPSTLTVYLRASLPLSLARCSGGSVVRPVLAGEPRSLEARYSERLPAYEAADLSMETEHRGPREIAEAIVEAAASRGFSRP